MTPARWIMGLLLGPLAAGLAWAAGGLTASGALAAALIGAVTLGAGGWPAAVLLLVFFFTSSGLSRWRPGNKQAVVADFAKGGRRDVGQVLANGGLPALLALLLGLTGSSLWLAGLAGALAASAADTWGTEIGVLAPGKPHLIINGQPVPAGTSGAISTLGSAAGLAGAALIGALAAWLAGGWQLALAVVAGGVAGTLLDSVLGATVQAIYRCPQCMKDTEKHPYHGCGTSTELVRGWSWLDNDLVNLASSLTGAMLAMLLAGLR
jgi:uncharacterized protein (TIGR00297 family)